MPHYFFNSCKLTCMEGSAGIRLSSTSLSQVELPQSPYFFSRISSGSKITFRGGNLSFKCNKSSIGDLDTTILGKIGDC